MKYILLILLLVPLHATATGSTVTSTSASVGIGNGGDASAVGFGGNAINAGNRQNSYINNENNTPRQHHNTPSFANFVPMGTAPCLVPFGGSGVGAGFGFGFSSSLKDENCMRNQSASVAAVNIGDVQLAKEIFCQGEYAKNTPTCMILNRDQASIKEELGGQLAAAEEPVKRRPPANNWGANFKE